MSQSLNNVKVLPGWSAKSAITHLPSEEKISLSPKSCGKGVGGKLHKMKLFIDETLLMLTLHSQS